MAAAPVAALVADTDVAKAVIDAAIIADVRTPIATIKAVAIMPEAPVAGGPEVAVAGSRWLIIFGQWRWRLRSVGHWLSAIAGIIRALIGRAARVGWRSTLLALLAVAIRCGHRSV
jgi:hypothetical protein